MESDLQSPAEQVVELLLRRLGGVARLGAGGEVELLAKIGRRHVAHRLCRRAQAVVGRARAVETAVEATMQVRAALGAGVAEADGVGDDSAAVVTSAHWCASQAGG